MAKFDISNITKSTEVGAYLKKSISEICYNALAAELGEEFVRLLEFEIVASPDDDTDVTIKKNAVIAECADTIDKDGFPVGILAEINVTIKKWNPTYSKKDNISHSAVTLADVDIGIENAAEVEKAKAEKKEREKQAKEKKIAADKARREKKAKGS